MRGALKTNKIGKVGGGFLGEKTPRTRRYSRLRVAPNFACFSRLNPLTPSHVTPRVARTPSFFSACNRATSTLCRRSGHCSHRSRFVIFPISGIVHRRFSKVTKSDGIAQRAKQASQTNLSQKGLRQLVGWGGGRSGRDTFLCSALCFLFLLSISAFCFLLSGFCFLLSVFCFLAAGCWRLVAGG